MTPRQLKLWRKRYNLSQDDAAKRIGCSRRAIQKWEAGETAIPKSIEMAIKAVTCAITKPDNEG